MCLVLMKRLVAGRIRSSRVASIIMKGLQQPREWIFLDHGKGAFTAAGLSFQHPRPETD